jgi:hypothetical protein
MTCKGICIRHEAVRPPDVLQGNLGLEIHVVSMVFFSLMLWLRFYYSERSGKKMIEDVDATLR